MTERDETTRPLTAEQLKQLREHYDSDPCKDAGCLVSDCLIPRLLDALDAREAQTCGVICPSCGAKIAERQ